jgi:hypothetical protein
LKVSLGKVSSWNQASRDKEGNGWLLTCRDADAASVRAHGQGLAAKPETIEDFVMVDQDQFFSGLLARRFAIVEGLVSGLAPLSGVRDVDFLGQNCGPVLDNVSRYRTSDRPDRVPTSNKSITIAAANDWKTRCYSFEWERTLPWRSTSPAQYFPRDETTPLEVFLGE